MLARPEWNKPEKREPMYPRVRGDDYRVILACFAFALLVWVVVIFPVIETLRQRSVDSNIARFGLQLR